MNITLAKTAGFCFGVNRAVQMVYDLVDENQKVCTLGPIIHNSQMVEELKSKGVRVVDEATQAHEDEILVIRSHGVGKSVYEEATKAGVKVCDATCPFVAKIHKIVAEQSADGDVILIAGDEHHHEVIGIIGHCTSQYYVFSNEQELENLMEKHPEFKEISISVVNRLQASLRVFIM